MALFKSNEKRKRCSVCRSCLRIHLCLLIKFLVRGVDNITRLLYRLLLPAPIITTPRQIITREKYKVSILSVETNLTKALFVIIGKYLVWVCVVSNGRFVILINSYQHNPNLINNTTAASVLYRQKWLCRGRSKKCHGKTVLQHQDGFNF